MTFLDGMIGVLSGRAGWVCGALIVIAAIGLSIFMPRTLFHSRFIWTAIILIAGFALGGAFLTPYAMAVSLRAERARSPMGTFQVQQITVDLLPDDPDAGQPISVQIWFPTEPTSPESANASACSALHSFPLAPGANARRLILYMPGWGGSRDDNAARLKYLASFGYVIAAFDDIAQDKAAPNATPEEEAVRTQGWNFASKDAYVQTLALSDVRVEREAKKALAVLDRLSACARADEHSVFAKSIDFSHVGFLGFSFGGASAAEAAIMDKRIVAVANLDGSFFGEAFKGRLEAPYLYVISDYPFPTLKTMNSDNPETRYFWRLAARDFPEQARLAARPGSGGIQIKGSVHESFTEAVFEPHAKRTWLFGNPVPIFEKVNICVREFFDAQLGAQAGVKSHAPQCAKLQGMKTFKEIGLTLDHPAYVLPPSD